MNLNAVLFVLLICVGSVIGQLRCYSCSFSAVETDQSCITISDDSPSVDCSMQYCIILRQEYLDPAGTVASFLRGCSDSPDYLNHEIVDSTFRTFYRACTTDLCNIGNGVQSVVGGNLDPNPRLEGPNLLVPGTGNSASIMEINVLLFCTVLLFIMR